MNRAALRALSILIAGGVIAAGFAKSNVPSSSLAQAASAAKSGGVVAHGKSIFSANCASCHGTAGAGGLGPSLKGEKSRKDLAAAIVWIKNPRPPMPKLYPSPLGDKDVAAVAAYVESL
jgi:mono/diheme cytochrome c family protein